MVEDNTADAKALALLLRCYGEMGMTPATHSKVSAPALIKPFNEFEAV